MKKFSYALLVFVLSSLFFFSNCIIDLKRATVEVTIWTQLSNNGKTNVYFWTNAKPTPRLVKPYETYAIQDYYEEFPNEESKDFVIYLKKEGSTVTDAQASFTHYEKGKDDKNEVTYIYIWDGTSLTQGI